MMNEMNWYDACAIAFILIGLGAAAKLPIGIGILFALVAIMFYLDKEMNKNK